MIISQIPRINDAVAFVFKKSNIFAKVMLSLKILVRYAFTMLFLLACTEAVSAQDGVTLASADSAADGNRYTMRSTMFGVGYVNRLETYLSPLEYTGTEFRFLHESMRKTKMMQQRISTQQFFEGNFSYTKSPTHDAEYFAGDFDWRIAWHYNWKVLPQLRLMAGAQTGVSGGFVYNTRNGNNPAQGKLSTNVAASGIAIYNFRFIHRSFTARYQVDLPMFGLMFSPSYGQSYYEIFSLGHYDHNVCFTWPFNAPCMSQLLSLDVPLNSGTLRVAYRMDVRQSKVNSLKSHTWSNLFMIGFVKHFKLVKERDAERSKFIY